jgi:transposase
LQSLRIRIKNELQNSLPKKQDIKSKETDEKLLTDLELLKRTRYLINKSETDWYVDQKTLMETLFEQHNEIKTAYKLTQQYKEWYRKDNKYLRTPFRIECELYQ